MNVKINEEDKPKGDDIRFTLSLTGENRKTLHFERNLESELLPILAEIEQELETACGTHTCLAVTDLSHRLDLRKGDLRSSFIGTYKIGNFITYKFNVSGRELHSRLEVYAAKEVVKKDGNRTTIKSRKMIDIISSINTEKKALTVDLRKISDNLNSILNDDEARITSETGEAIQGIIDDVDTILKSVSTGFYSAQEKMANNG